MDYKCIDFPMMDNIFFNLWNKDRVGKHENLFILFLMAIKITGSVQKHRVGRVSRNTGIFFFWPNRFVSYFPIHFCIL